MAIITTIFTAIWSGIKVACMFIYKAIVWTVQMIVKILKAIWEFITQHAGTFFKSMGRFFLNLFKWIGNLFVKGWRWLAALFTGFAAGRAAKPPKSPKDPDGGSSNPDPRPRPPHPNPPDPGTVQGYGSAFGNFLNGLTGGLFGSRKNSSSTGNSQASGTNGTSPYSSTSYRLGNSDSKIIFKVPGLDMSVQGRHEFSDRELAYFDYQRDKTQRHKKEEFEWQQVPKARQADRHYDLVSTGKILYKDGKANSDAAVIAADRTRYLRDQQFRETFEHKWAKKANSPFVRNGSEIKKNAAKSRLFLREQKKAERAAMFDDAWNAASLMRSQSAAERKAQKAARKQREYEDYRAEYYRKQQHKRDLEKIYAKNRKH